MRFPCAHVRLASLHDLQSNVPGQAPVEQPRIMDYVHRMHFCRPALAVLNEEASHMVIPAKADLLNRHCTVLDVLQPPPRYTS
jgi:hypothetical protein